MSRSTVLDQNRPNGHSRPAIGCLTGALLCAVVLGCAGEARAAKWDSPEKLDDRDIALPLPRKGGEDWQFVLRRVEVPGTAFWEDSRRFVEFGESGDADVFERFVPIEVRGAVLGESNWQIWLGKYETTIAQYALVAGEGDLEAGLARYIEMAGLDEQAAAGLAPGAKGRDVQLAMPVDRLPPSEIQRFLRALNATCYAHQPCRAALPQVGARARVRDARYAPFFRLPTEIEWEYVARGVADAPADRRDRLPVSERKIGDFAQLDKVRTIGRKRPLFGFHDLFGNVAELVDGRMGVHAGAPGSGAWLARGGKAGRAFSKAPYTAQREEILEFEWREGDDAPTPISFRRIGFRVALGAPLQSFAQLAVDEKPRKAAISDERAVPTAPGTAGGTVVNELVELAGAVRRGGADEALARRLDAALERLQDDEDKLNARLARFVADSAFLHLMRHWSVTRSIDQNGRVLDITERRATAGTLSDKAKASRKKLVDQLEADELVVRRLADAYEAALSATAAIPGVSASLVEALDTGTFEQSREQIALFTAAKKLLGQHIEAVVSGARFDVGRALVEAYPLSRTR